MKPVRAASERGFSLIEVLVSLGLLAGVMVAVSSLFIFGGKEVKSGKEMTEAYSVAHDIVEEIDRLTYTQAWQYFAPTSLNSAIDTNYTLLTTAASGYSAQALATLAAYQANIDDKLYNSRATLKFEGLDVAGAAATFDSAIALRVTVTVDWYEGSHQRFLQLRSVRF